LLLRAKHLFVAGFHDQVGSPQRIAPEPLGATAAALIGLRAIGLKNRASGYSI
jgi:hypothetical protein